MVPSMTSDDEVARLREENAHLRTLLERSSPDHRPVVAIGSDTDQRSSVVATGEVVSQGDVSLQWDGHGHRLTKEQVARYSRQIILPSFGVQGNLPLKWPVPSLGGRAVSNTPECTPPDRQLLLCHTPRRG